MIMMIRLRQICLTVMILVGVGGTLSAENPRIGTVDMQRLFKEYYRTNEAQQRFNLEYANIQKEVNERIDAIGQLSLKMKKLEGEILNSELADSLKKQKKDEFGILMQKRRLIEAEKVQFEEQEKSKIARLKQASMQGIMTEIRQRVIGFSEREGYDFVFDKSGKNTNQVTFFIYLKDARDITSTVLAELNKLAPGAMNNQR